MDTPALIEADGWRLAGSPAGPDANARFQANLKMKSIVNNDERQGITKAAAP
jgi:hypothetical protein